MNSFLLKKNHLVMLSAMLIGGTIEWYELYLFIHWSSVFSKLFFYDLALFGVYNVLFIFFIGVLGRPMGALLFGNIGDRFGRRIAFTMSIALMVLPSFLIAGIGWILPSTGIATAIILCLLRFMQGMAIGAELPGAMCYLAEYAVKKERAFICSFTFVGPHIGIFLSQLESYILEKYFSEHFIENYGWRLSFILGGILALVGVIFRNSLDESPAFTKLQRYHRLSHNPISEAFSKYWKQLLNCFLTFLVSVVVFFMYTIFIEIYLSKFFEMNQTTTFIVGMVITFSEIIFLPFWGILGDKYSLKKFLIVSTILILSSAIFIYFFQTLQIIVLFSILILIGLNIQSGLMPCYIAELFPTSIRYTGIAISVSLCDSLIGGGVPWLGGLLGKKMGMKEAFVIVTVASATISLITFLLTKRNVQRGAHFS